jgi:hypothetical protein
MFFVEKSPHSFLKIALLRRLFRSAKSVKFIIVMKVSCKPQLANVYCAEFTCVVFLLQHPVTLNVAAPKGYTWTHRKATDQTGEAVHALKLLTVQERALVGSFFADMMLHDNSTLYPHRFVVSLITGRVFEEL